MNTSKSDSPKPKGSLEPVLTASSDILAEEASMFYAQTEMSKENWACFSGGLELPRKTLTEWCSHHWKSIQSCVQSNKLCYTSNPKEYCVTLLEDVMILSYDLISLYVEGRLDIKFASLKIINFVKLRTHKSFVLQTLESSVTDRFNKIFCETPLLQSGLEENLLNARSFLDKYAELRETDLIKKLEKFQLYLLSYSILEPFGVNFESLNYSKFEAARIRQTHSSKIGFVQHLCDTLTYVCLKGYQILKTGEISPLFHSGDTYTAFYDKFRAIKDQSQYLDCPEAIGIDENQYRIDLEKLIDEAKCIVERTKHKSESSTRYIRGMYHDLVALQQESLSHEFARGFRKAPFSVLINGDSGIGKSTFVNVVFRMAAETMKLECDKRWMYPRNAFEDYWTNFTTSQWAILFDELGSSNPDRSQMEAGMKDILSVVNVTPYVPNQADLLHKGKTPIRAKLVMATTNVKHFNSHKYFAFPSAAQRRFPFVITPVVKPEFRAEGSTQLRDDLTTDDIFPDWWDITIEKVIPAPQGSGYPAFARYENLHPNGGTFNMKEFMHWCVKAITTHMDAQKKVDKSISDIQKRPLCLKCMSAKDICQCSIETQSGSNVNAITIIVGLANLPFFFAANFVFYPIIMAFWLAIYFYFNPNHLHRLMFVAQFIGAMRNHAEHVRRELRYLGDSIRDEYHHPSYLTKIAGMIAIAYSGFKIYKFFFPSFDPQGGEVSKGVTPKPKEYERRSVWYNAEMALSSTDLSPQSSCQNTRDVGEIMGKLANDLIHIRIYANDLVSKPTKGFCLYGNLYVVNNHAIETVKDHVILKLTVQRGKLGITENISVKITEKDILRFPEKDIAILRIHVLPPKKGIYKYLIPKADIFSAKSIYVSRASDGDIYHQEVGNIVFGNNMTLAGHKMPIITTELTNITEKGDCGSVLISLTNYGFTIVGMHLAISHYDGSAISTELSQEFFDKLKLVDTVSGFPLLNAKSTDLQLGELSPKSVFRYLPTGTASVFGSYVGENSHGKSKVGITPMAPFLETKGYEVKYTDPEMRSFLPWRIAALDMVNPIVDIAESEVKEAANLYFDEVLRLLPEGALDELEVYDNYTVCNGAPEIAYVDHIKWTTSAGYPWRTGKKRFTERIEPRLGHTVARQPVDEVDERVTHILDCYSRNERAMPIFTAHLKDEPVTFAKRSIGKTRVFAGAPFDFTIVVRKFFLSSIRLMQNHKLVFECAVGTVAQSPEWTELGEYITEYSSENLIAGDYKAFDKRMPPIVIMEAFNVLIKLCEKSGNFSDGDLQAMRCISKDIAYPLMHYNGDLIQFFGSNPSGHPLTVIINCIANSIYMRLAYKDIVGDMSSFRRNVKLLTYGDDNVAGVHDCAKIFNQISVSQALAKLGITYTDAFKKKADRKFIPFSEASFLKRTWRWDSDLNYYTAPLDHESIEKSLMVWTRSRIPESEQAMAIIGSAVREYFFYGKATYYKRCSLLRELVNYLGFDELIQDSTFPTWESLAKDFVDYKLLVCTTTSDIENQRVVLSDSNCDLQCSRRLRVDQIDSSLDLEHSSSWTKPSMYEVKFPV